jgi:predicted ArsR family transcriptional regulator
MAPRTASSLTTTVSVRVTGRLPGVDRLSLFKVLAEPSRYAIYEEVVAADHPLSRLDLHPNTVRLHLEKLRDAGLVSVAADRHGSIGRPQHRWSLGANGPSLGLEPAGFRLLAHLLADVAVRAQAGPESVAESGRRRGQERRRGHSQPHSSNPPGTRSSCIRALMEEFSDLGFDPALDSDPAGPAGASEGEVVEISFTRCPFRELAVLYPDLVCQLHQGITEGIVAAMTDDLPGLDAHLDSFSSLVDPDPCRVEVSIRS